MKQVTRERDTLPDPIYRCGEWSVFEADGDIWIMKDGAKTASLMAGPREEFTRFMVDLIRQLEDVIRDIMHEGSTVIISPEPITTLPLLVPTDTPSVEKSSAPEPPKEKRPRKPPAKPKAAVTSKPRKPKSKN